MGEAEFYDQVAIQVAVALAQNSDRAPCMISAKASDVAYEMLRSRREHLGLETLEINREVKAPA